MAQTTTNSNADMWPGRSITTHAPKAAEPADTGTDPHHSGKDSLLWDESATAAASARKEARPSVYRIRRVPARRGATGAASGGMLCAPAARPLPALEGVGAWRSGHGLIGAVAGLLAALVAVAVGGRPHLHQPQARRPSAGAVSRRRRPSRRWRARRCTSRPTPPIPRPPPNPPLLGFAFWTTDLVPKEHGYHGPIHILVGMDLTGILTGVIVDYDSEPYGYFSVQPPEFARAVQGQERPRAVPGRRRRATPCRAPRSASRARRGPSATARGPWRKHVPESRPTLKP